MADQRIPGGRVRSAVVDDITEFLAFYPRPIAEQAMALRGLVREAVPEAVERLRPGWRLIGYDLPIHIGWQTGTLMSDPRRLLRGAHLKLRKVRYLTYAPREPIEPGPVIEFTRDPARIASLPRGERELLALSRPAGGA
jgi:hypothetical protein